MGYENTSFNYLNNDEDLPNDDIVPAWSCEKIDKHINLRKTNHCHTDLLGNLEFNMSKRILAPMVDILILILFHNFNKNHLFT
ncbi:hypothetical protein [Candidatus Nitrosocosmicus sp. SS]|uniref:hypothetical protein n=1 Tax=Candidatus Nitrosocosmicus agrestis TaxID=2563600 RepID=UPI00122E9D0B|nr:hypothetical protein [Candidatus Nitrosocosmicus sp. SS]KAA2282476.1 hypothetical protein F1Z66_06230 [Candidatus Nitrosocosmicus sp. SS]KAF0868742.1 hypothetical protein E5N71_08665 [Candidatus Nitrosocosmicus sp. SS]